MGSRTLIATIGTIAYLATSWLYVRNGPGVEYDEALSVRGARLLLDRRIPCRADIDLSIGHNCIPLMVAPYVGAVKSLAVLPFFRAFGPSTEVARMGAALLVAACLFFCALSLGSPFACAIFAAAFAANPVLYGLPIFDDTNLAAVLPILGLTLYFTSRVYQRPTPLAFFALGLALGIGGWARLNFVWFWLALLAAAVSIHRRSLFQKPTRALALFAGLICGFFPVVCYHLSHRGLLAGFMSSHAAFSNPGEYFAFVLYRLRMLSELFVSDGERRAIWGGPAYPGLLTTAVSCCVFLCLPLVAFLPARSGVSGFVRTAGASGCFLLPLFLTSNMPVAEHHMAILLPLALLSLGHLATLFLKRGPMVRASVAGFLAVYLVLCIYWNVQTFDGLRRTGGKSFWSSSIDEVANFLIRNRASHIGVLDWGLESNLEFVSGGAVSGEELFWSYTAKTPGNEVPWLSEIKHRRFFVATAGASRVFPQAADEFRKALVSSGVPYSIIPIGERDRSPYAVIYKLGDR